MKTVIHYTSVYLPIRLMWLYGQIKYLKRYQPIVYTRHTENLDIYPVRIIRSLDIKPGRTTFKNWFNNIWNKIFDFYPSFAFHIRKDSPDLIHAHFGHVGYSCLTFKKMFKLPLITTFYGYDLSRLPSQYPEWKKRYTKLFREGEGFLVEGHHMKGSLVELGCPEEKIIVQHLGIDLEQLKFVPRAIEEDEEIRVLTAATFREKKGIPYAVEAFARVKQAHPELKFKLSIIGDSRGYPSDEEEKKKIVNTIRKYDLENSVNMLGLRKRPGWLRELYRHHLFIHPSVHASDGDTEGGVPVSIIEASASGLPILSTTHCDIPEVVIEGKSGYLVAERDVDALAERLEYLVFNPTFWGKMGLFGRTHIETNYDVKKQVQRLEEIYDRVILEE